MEIMEKRLGALVDHRMLSHQWDAAAKEANVISNSLPLEAVGTNNVITFKKDEQIYEQGHITGLLVRTWHRVQRCQNLVLQGCRVRKGFLSPLPVYSVLLLFILVSLL